MSQSPAAPLPIQSPYVCFGAHCRLLSYVGEQPHTYGVITAASVRHRGVAGIIFRTPPAHRDGVTRPGAAEASPGVEAVWLDQKAGMTLFPVPPSTASTVPAPELVQGYLNRDFPAIEGGRGAAEGASPTKSSAKSIRSQQVVQHQEVKEEGQFASASALQASSPDTTSTKESLTRLIFPAVVLRRTLLQAILILQLPGRSPAAQFFLVLHHPTAGVPRLQQPIALAVLPTPQRSLTSEEGLPAPPCEPYRFVLGASTSFNVAKKRNHEEPHHERDIIHPQLACVEAASSSRVLAQATFVMLPATPAATPQETLHSKTPSQLSKAVLASASGVSGGNGPIDFVNAHIIPSLLRWIADTTPSAVPPTAGQLRGLLQHRSFLLLAYLAHLAWLACIAECFMQKVGGSKERAGVVTVAPTGDAGQHTWCSALIVGNTVIFVSSCQGALQWTHAQSPERHLGTLGELLRKMA